MDEKDREIIQLLQDNFPLESEPYKVIGDKLWMDEVSVISRIAKMFESGAIRHLGPFFNGRQLGFKGCLAAVNVEDSRIDAVAEVINAYPEITHNYLREGTPNMWFTIVSPTEARREEIINEIKTKTNIDEILLFASRKLYKIRVALD